MGYRRRLHPPKDGRDEGSERHMEYKARVTCGVELRSTSASNQQSLNAMGSDSLVRPKSHLILRWLACEETKPGVVGSEGVTRLQKAERDFVLKH